MYIVPFITGIAVAFVAVIAPPVSAASFLGVDVPPPLPGNNVVDTYWNTPVNDPYRFLESTKDPVVQAWMKAQADATEAIPAIVSRVDPQPGGGMRRRRCSKIAHR